ncbi:hypothetical protein [Niabella sp.]|uniref:hypothetical protein n=1 Tax=Niabella sp. TaxID=1962976 RepID=UPI002615CACD|nr:hypothetical protein [Niabella sp.]
MKKLILYCLLIFPFIAAKADPVITAFTATPSNGNNIRITGNSLSVNFYLLAARSYPPQGGSSFEPGTITLRLVYKTSSGQIEPITDYKTYNASDYNNGAFLDIHIDNIILPSSSIGKTLTAQYSYWSSTAGQTLGPMLLNGYYSIIGNPAADTTTISSIPMPIILKASNTLAVFAKTANNNAAYKSRTSSDWTAWQDLSGPIKYTPIALSKDNYNVDVFAIGTDDHLYYKWKNSANVWSGWNNFGGNFAAAPAVVSRGGFSIEVFATGLDNHIYYKWWNSTNSWSAWNDFGGNFASAPVAISKNQYSIDVFAVGTDNHLYYKYWGSPNGWSATWTDFGGSFAAPPAVVSRDGNSIDVFAVGTDGHLYYKYWSINSGWSSAWYDFGGNFVSTPAAVSRGGITLEVFATGSDNHLHYMWWSSANGWSTWNDVGGDLNSAPAAISKDAQSIDVFAQSTNNSLIRKSYTSSGWSNWETISGY